MSFHSPQSLSPAMVNFLLGSPRLAMTADMPMVPRGIGSLVLLNKLVSVYLFTSQDDSPSLIFYAKRNLLALQKFLTQTLTPEIKAGLTENALDVSNSFLKGEVPDSCNTSDIKSALREIGWTEDSHVKLEKSDGITCSERVLINQLYGADPWMLKHLGRAFNEIEIDPQGFTFSQLMAVYGHCMTPISGLELEGVDWYVYKNTLCKWRDQWADILTCARDGTVTPEQHAEFLKNSDLIGTSALETVRAVSFESSTEPIGDALRTATELYIDTCKVNAYLLKTHMSTRA
jgi:hypothetical protein